MQTNETIAEVIAAQMVVPAYMREIAERHGADTVVTVTRKVTPFGTFVMGIEVAA